MNYRAARLLWGQLLCAVRLIYRSRRRLLLLLQHEVRLLFCMLKLKL